jgi:hypothetical protein
MEITNVMNVFVVSGDELPDSSAGFASLAAELRLHVR